MSTEPMSLDMALDSARHPGEYGRPLTSLALDVLASLRAELARRDTFTATAGAEVAAVPELRFCQHSGMVLRRMDGGSWCVLDAVAEADPAAVDAAMQLVRAPAEPADAGSDVGLLASSPVGPEAEREEA